ncbi:hypothetical protein DFH11DRAFT_1612355 [Phellopilus nigrolimitatus]|nr:hypothetical protein DFH11DRAFT_1612355 [Phellopilus nigrolimitatus]
MMSAPTSPSAKRIKLESDPEDDDLKGAVPNDPEEDLDGDHCSICLQLFVDRTVIPECSHEFCFDCILIWTGQSRRCPLCTRTIGPYLIHHIRSNFDYQKYHLPPLRSSPPPIQPLRRFPRSSTTRRPGHWGRRERRERDVADELERAIDKRRWIYHNHLYAKHVASNTFTRYRPFPTPAQFSASQDFIGRATVFIRRELRVWVNLDVEFLTTFILSLMKAIDIRSESAVKLLAEFLDIDIPYSEGTRLPNAEHFAHEVYSYLRSPYKSLAAYDANVQYDIPKDNYQLPDHDALFEPDQAVRPRNGESPRRLREPEPLPLDENGSSGSNLASYGNPNASDATRTGSYRSQLLSDTGRDNEYLRSVSLYKSNEPLSTLRTMIAASPSHATASMPLIGLSTEGPSQRDPKGKGRQQAATAEDDSATQVTTGNGHLCTMPASLTPLRLPEVSRNRDDASNTQDATSLTSKPLRMRNSRNPLSIAQAHLSKASMVRGTVLNPPIAAAITRSDVQADLRRNSKREDEPPSLLSRIADSLTLDAPAIADTTAASARSTEDASDQVDGLIVHETVTSRIDMDSRARLLNRLETERARQVSGRSFSGFDGTRQIEGSNANAISNFTNSTFSSHSASALVEHVIKGDSIPNKNDDRGIVDTDAKLRSRARLQMKLVVEKQLAYGDQTDKDVNDAQGEASAGLEIIPSSEKASREDLLKNTLVKRRRGG